MNILLLAPQPFYQDRGTPIAVDLLLRTLCERGYQIDLVTYHEGRTINYENVNIHRIFDIPFVRNIHPGFSWKKLVCDFFMFFKVLSLAYKKNYQVVHAVEESVFMALVLKLIFKVPYVYDMDSSLPQQFVEKYPFCALFGSSFSFFERIAVKGSEAVVPVCDSLGDIAMRHNPKKLVILNDVSLLNGEKKEKPIGDLRTELGIDGLILMYVGNLEAYQGIDLMLESFALALEQGENKANLVVIGGADSDIQKYKKKSLTLGLGSRVHFLGPKPAEDLSGYLSEADILVSPRIKGKNTPMKIYSYLHSGKTVLATDLPTHTQVLDSRVAMLAEPYPEKFSNGMLRLMHDKDSRSQLGEAGKRLIEEKYSYESFKVKLNGLYDWLETKLKHRTPASDIRKQRV